MSDDGFNDGRLMDAHRRRAPGSVTAVLLGGALVDWPSGRPLTADDIGDPFAEFRVKFNSLSRVEFNTVMFPIVLEMPGRWAARWWRLRSWRARRRESAREAERWAAPRDPAKTQAFIDEMRSRISG